MIQAYKPRIVVVDGPSGSGKTTLTEGKSQRTPDTIISPSLQEMPGYVCFKELQTKARHELARKGINTNDKNWERSFLETIVKLETEQRIPRLQQLEHDKTAVLDKSHYHFYANAENLGVDIPKDVKEFYDSIKYDAVFLCRPAESYNNKRSERHSFARASEKFDKLTEMYQQEGYNPVELPLVEGDLQETARQRMDIVRQTLGP